MSSGEAGPLRNDALYCSDLNSKTKNPLLPRPISAGPKSDNDILLEFDPEEAPGLGCGRNGSQTGEVVDFLYEALGHDH